MSAKSLRRHAEAGSLAKPDECKVCERKWEFGGWDLHHGWAHCRKCGLLYCILDYDDNDGYNGPEVVQTEEFVKALSDFYAMYQERYDESDKFLPFLEDNYPELVR